MEMTAEATAEMTEVGTEPALSETTPEATLEAIAEATAEMTTEATMEMTTEATMEMTTEATMEATAEATAEMTAEATMEATDEATAEPTAEATARAGSIEWVCPADYNGQTLNIYNWADYIGDTTISDFETLCGVTVILDFYDTNETLITKMRTGNPGYDIAFPNDYAIKIMAEEGLIQKINFANIPNSKNTDPRWQGQYFDPNNEWGVPYLWSSFGIAYNTNKVTTAPTSWNDFFNYDGPVSWMDDYRGMFGAAYWLAGVDASTIDPAQIEAAKQFLMANNKNAVMMQGGFTDPMVSGEVDMMMTYSAYAFELLDDCQCTDFVYVVPQEGSAVDVTNAVILTGAQNVPLAEAFIDYLNDPYVAAKITNDLGYATTNKAAIESGYIEPALLSNPILFPFGDVKLELYRPITEAETEYQNAWDEIRISMGM
jgi:spermidine/putrescine transport system substrate-binding protein